MSEIKLFIVARPRTGGTLMATMLNAHSQLSMAYEMYPDLLVAPSGKGLKTSDLAKRLKAAQHADKETWAKALERDKFRVFVARARRSGLEPNNLLSVLHRFLDKKLDTLDERLDFIDALWHQQAQLDNKPFIGGKMRVEPENSHQRHPNAVFLMMLRDGRDVLDSRLKVGNFSTTAAACAEDWMQSLSDFENWLTTSGAKGRLVKYEALVADPESELHEIFKLANIPFENAAINYLSANQPLFENAHGHLSANQISGGLSSASIGRWKSGLEDQDVKTFEAVAGKTLRKHGYL
jgi:hypothetical protein